MATQAAARCLTPWTGRTIRIAAYLTAFAALTAYRFAVITGDFRNSDDAGNFLAGVAVSEGNVRLHGWIMAPENYYPIDVLGEAILKLLLGWHPLLMQGLEALIWAAIACVGTALACAGQPPRRLAGIVATSLALLAFSLFEHGLRDVPLANIGSHGGTILLMLLTFAVASGNGLAERPKLRATVLCALMTLGSLSDRIYLVVACLPVLAEAVLALNRRDNVAALIRILITVAAFVLAHLLLVLNALTGGFQTSEYPIPLATFPQIVDQAVFAAQSIVRLLGADPFGRDLQHGLQSAAAITLLRAPFMLMFLIAWWEVGAGVLRRIRRWPPAASARPHADLQHLLWLSLSACVASACIMHVIGEDAAIRYFLPASVTGSILVARRFGRLILTGAFGTIALLASLICGLAFRSPDPPGQVVAAPAITRIVEALRAAHLQHGYAGYWQGNIVTVLTHRDITSLPVIEQADHRLHAYTYFTNLDWYRTAARAWHGRTFFISEHTDGAGNDVLLEATVIRQFGPPAQRIDLGQFVIDVYDLPPGALHGLDG
jgi:hypothetical protein